MKFLYYLIVLLFAAACNAEDQYKPITRVDSTAIQEAAVFTDTVFKKELSIDTFKADVYGVENNNGLELIVFASYNGKVLSETHKGINGRIKEARIADLNNNRIPEVYIITETDSGEELIKLIGLEYTTAEPREIELPGGNPVQEFRIEGNTIKKKLALANEQSTYVSYQLTAGGQLVEQPR